MMHVRKDSVYTQDKPSLTDNEYRKFSNELSVLLKSSKVRAKIALVHGEGIALGVFNELWSNYLTVSSVLRTATRSAWIVKENKEIHDIFSIKIDPLRYKLEKLLLKNARANGVAKTLALRHFPTFSRMACLCSKNKELT